MSGYLRIYKANRALPHTGKIWCLKIRAIFKITEISMKNTIKVYSIKIQKLLTLLALQGNLPFYKKNRALSSTWHTAGVWNVQKFFKMLQSHGLFQLNSKILDFEIVRNLKLRSRRKELKNSIKTSHRRKPNQQKFLRSRNSEKLTTKCKKFSKPPVIPNSLNNSNGP